MVRSADTKAIFVDSGDRGGVRHNWRIPPLPRALVALSILFFVGAAHADTEVTTCGQYLEGPGYLSADLLGCTDYAAVVMDKGASLDLRGFTVAGATYTIYCEGACEVVGPGTITGASYDGIAALGTLKIRDVTARDNRLAGVLAGRSLKATNVTLTGNGKRGYEIYGHVKIDGATITGNGEGGVANSTRLYNAMVTNNLRGGVRFTHAAVRDSTLASNVSDPDCGVTIPCADLMGSSELSRTPRLKRSSCETSYKGTGEVPGDTWGVCTLD